MSKLLHNFGYINLETYANESAFAELCSLTKFALDMVVPL